MNENEIRDALAAGIGEEPPIAGGPAAVFAAARTRVVRTRVMTGALSAVAVLGVAAGAVAFSGGSGGADGAAGQSTQAGPGAQCAVGKARVVKGEQPPANEATEASSGIGTAPGSGVTTARSGVTSAGSPAFSSSSGQTSAAAATSSPGAGGQSSAPGPVPAGWVRTDPQSLLLLLKQALPCGTPSGYRGQVDVNVAAPTGGLQVNGSMALADRFGVGTVAVSVEQNGEWRRSQMACTPHPDNAPCSSQKLPDGTVVKAEELWFDATTARVVEVLRPGGLHITVSAGNQYTPWGQLNSKKPTRPTPPLTLDQLRAIAMDVPWSFTMAPDSDAQAKREITPYVDTKQGQPIPVPSKPTS